MPLLPQCREFRRGNLVPVRALFRIRQCDYNDALRVLDWRGAQQNSTLHTEKCRIQTYSQAESNDYRETEGGGFPVHSQPQPAFFHTLFDSPPLPLQSTPTSH